MTRITLSLTALLAPALLLGVPAPAMLSTEAAAASIYAGQAMTGHSASSVLSPDSIAIDPCPEPADSLQAAPQEVPEFKRKLESTVFIPKGQWAAGVSVNYSQTTQNDYAFLILEHLSGDTYSFKVSPMLVYFVHDDLGIGGRFAYSRSLTKLENADIVLDSETSYGVEDFYRLSHSFSAMAIMRNYFSIGTSKRFGLFNELQLEFGGGQSKLMKGRSTELTGAYETNFHFNVGLAPGICVFLNNYSAMEINVGVLGFGLTKTKQINDRIYESHRKHSSANFRINLFSIMFGMTFYL